MLALVLDWVLRTKWAVVWVIVAVVSGATITTGSRIRQTPTGPGTWMRRISEAHRRPADLIMGSTELGWELGWKSNLVDDFRFGFFTGKKPDIIVTDKNRYQEWIPNLKIFNQGV